MQSLGIAGVSFFVPLSRSPDWCGGRVCLANFLRGPRIATCLMNKVLCVVGASYEYVLENSVPS